MSADEIGGPTGFLIAVGRIVFVLAGLQWG
jgi:hypothetical protein